MVTRESTDAQPVIENLSWAPSVPGDFIGGVCTFCDFSVSTKYGLKLLIKIDADEVIAGSESLPPDTYQVWEKTHLRESALRLKLVAGDNVGIKFERAEEVKGGGNAKKIFKLHVEKTDNSEAFIRPPMNVNEAIAIEREAQAEAAGVGQDHKDDLSGLGA